MSVFSEMDLEKKYEGDPFAEDDELLNTAGLEAKTTPSVVTAAPESPEPPASPAPAAPADKATEDEGEEAKRKAHKEAEAKRKAEFEARQAEKKAAEQEQLAKLEAMSVEDHGAGVSYNVYLYNVQPGIWIDYATGDNWAEEQGAA